MSFCLIMRRTHQGVSLHYESATTYLFFIMLKNLYVINWRIEQ